MKRMEPRPYVLYLLTRRDYSRRELLTKLRKRGVDDADGNALIDALRDEGWFRERAAIESKLRGWVRRGLSSKEVIARASKNRVRIDLNEIRKVREELGTTESDPIRTQVRKLLRVKLKGEKLSNLSREESFKLRRKITASIAGKGHPLSLIRQIFDDETSTSG